jgi:hypothetical protein
VNPDTSTTGPWIQLPIPLQGELYVRYGEPGSVSVESLTGKAGARYVDLGTTSEQAGTLPAASAGLTEADVQAIVQRVLQEELARYKQAAGDSSSLYDAALVDRLETRLNVRIDALERRLEDQVDRAAPRVASPTLPPVIIRQPESQPQTTGVTNDNGRIARSTMRNERVGILPITGFSVNNSPQFIVGLRGDLRSSSRAIRFLPELTLGFGEGRTSYTLSANAAYPFNIAIGSLQPYIGAGVGFARVNDFKLVFNTFIGAQRSFGLGSFFGEFYTMDFFNENRVIFGYRVNIW